MFGKKNDQQPQETPAPTLPAQQTPEYIRNLEALIRVIARDEAMKVLTEVLTMGGKDLQGDGK